MDWREIIPGKLAIKFNHPRKVFYYFSLGEIMNGSLFKFNKTTKYKVAINVVKHPRDHVPDTGGHFSSFYKVGDGWVLYERKYGGLSCELAVTGMDSNNLTIYVNSFYLNYIKIKVDNMYPVGIHVTDILLSKMIGDNDLVIHGASLYDTNKKVAFLLVAPPDTGKTYTTYKLLEQGYKFLGEDLSYYDGESDSLICMPYTSTWGHRFKLKALDVSKVPFVGMFSNSAKKGVEEIFGKESVVERERLDRIYILEKSNTEESISKAKVDDSLIRKVMAIQRNEFSYYKNPLLRAYEYYHSVDLDGVAAIEARNINKLFEDKEVYLVRAPHYERYKDLISKHI